MCSVYVCVDMVYKGKHVQCTQKHEHTAPMHPSPPHPVVIPTLYQVQSQAVCQTRPLVCPAMAAPAALYAVCSCPGTPALQEKGHQGAPLEIVGPAV